MEIGIDSFATIRPPDTAVTASDPIATMAELLERIEWAEKFGLDIFGVGEHHRK